MLPHEFVDHLLRWANGLKGKLDKLAKPLFEKCFLKTDYTTLRENVDAINVERNSVAHQGIVKTRKVAREIISKTDQAIKTLFNSYEAYEKANPNPTQERLKSLDHHLDDALTKAGIAF